jgi:hypothetical protein
VPQDLSRKSGPKSFRSSVRPRRCLKNLVPNSNQAHAPRAVSRTWSQIFPIKPAPQDLSQGPGPKSFRLSSHPKVCFKILVPDLSNEARAPRIYPKNLVPNLSDQAHAPGYVSRAWSQIFAIKPAPSDLSQESVPKSFRSSLRLGIRLKSSPPNLSVQSCAPGSVSALYTCVIQQTHIPITRIYDDAGLGRINTLVYILQIRHHCSLLLKCVMFCLCDVLFGCCVHPCNSAAVSWDGS